MKAYRKYIAEQNDFLFATEIRRTSSPTLWNVLMAIRGVTELKKQTGFNGSGRPCSAALGLGRVQGLFYFFGKEGK